MSENTPKAVALRVTCFRCGGFAKLPCPYCGSKRRDCRICHGNVLTCRVCDGKGYLSAGEIETPQSDAQKDDINKC